MPPDQREALRWAAYAEEDYEYALLGLQTHPRNAGWDFHQAAEKYLKAALLNVGQELPRTHDLLRLLSLLAPELPSDDERVIAASTLALFGVASRYPGDLPEVSVEDAKRAQSAALTLRTFARSKGLPNEV